MKGFVFCYEGLIWSMGDEVGTKEREHVIFESRQTHTHIYIYIYVYICIGDAENYDR